SRRAPAGCAPPPSSPRAAAACRRPPGTPAPRRARSGRGRSRSTAGGSRSRGAGSGAVATAAGAGGAPPAGAGAARGAAGAGRGHRPTRDAVLGRVVEDDVLVPVVVGRGDADLRPLPAEIGDEVGILGITGDRVALPDGLLRLAPVLRRDRLGMVGDAPEVEA